MVDSEPFQIIWIRFWTVLESKAFLPGLMHPSINSSHSPAKIETWNLIVQISYSDLSWRG